MEIPPKKVPRRCHSLSTERSQKGRIRVSYGKIPFQYFSTFPRLPFALFPPPDAEYDYDCLPARLNLGRARDIPEKSKLHNSVKLKMAAGYRPVAKLPKEYYFVD